MIPRELKILFIFNQLKIIINNLLKNNYLSTSEVFIATYLK